MGTSEAERCDPGTRWWPLPPNGELSPTAPSDSVLLIEQVELLWVILPFVGVVDCSGELDMRRLQLDWMDT